MGKHFSDARHPCKKIEYTLNRFGGEGGTRQGLLAHSVLAVLLGLIVRLLINYFHHNVEFVKIYAFSLICKVLHVYTFFLQLTCYNFSVNSTIIQTASAREVQQIND